VTDQTGPVRQDPTERCTCGHTKRDHSGRRDHHDKYGPTVAGRPWCHACETECIYCPPDPEAPENAAEPELTAEEARALADELSTDLYWAQDRLAFVGECCDIADRDQRTITTADVREWLKGARCGRQLAADAATATQATELEKTARVFAALHRSAEQDVSRVIALYEQWVKAGPPPLGASLARWWDARLVELHDAIRPPADQPKER
jgi:Holliday junction resolvase-like predicted endonuclease